MKWKTSVLVVKLGLPLKHMYSAVKLGLPLICMYSINFLVKYTDAIVKSCLKEIPKANCREKLNDIRPVPNRLTNDNMKYHSLKTKPEVLEYHVKDNFCSKFLFCNKLFKSNNNYRLFQLEFHKLEDLILKFVLSRSAVLNSLQLVSP